nr:type I inositol polyphosphate 5-phosphatase 2-like isoform X2 [Ziziphus jujuba var. spinosa]
MKRFSAKAWTMLFSKSFQEVVPLNAGNVLGVEDTRPIPKWEAIIRRTLNKSLEPESIHKSYSAPPSPVLRTSSVADVLADDIDPLDLMSEEPIGTANCYDLEGDDSSKVIGIFFCEHVALLITVVLCLLSFDLWSEGRC